MIEVDGHSRRGVSGSLTSVEPLDDVALDGVGQIVHGVGAVGEAEVDDGRGARVGRLDRSRKDWRRADRCGSRAGVSAGRAAQVRRERARGGRGPVRRRRARLHGEPATGARRDSAPWLRWDRSAAKMVKLATSGRGLRGGAAKSLRGKMETRERLPGGMRVGRGAKRRPGDRVLVEIDARGDFVHLVGPVADFDRGFSRGGSKDARDGCAVGEQMREKTMLLEQALAIAHGCVMALDEDVAVSFVATTPAAENGRGLTVRMRSGSPSAGNWARSARTSASVSGGQSGGTSVPSMPWAFAAAVIVFDLCGSAIRTHPVTSTRPFLGPGLRPRYLSSSQKV